MIRKRFKNYFDCFSCGNIFHNEIYNKKGIISVKCYKNNVNFYK